VLGDSLSAWAFAPGSACGSASGTWPRVLAAMDSGLTLVHNGGVPGNTTSQMLARMQHDVLAYHPDVLFVLGGTNDVADDFAVSKTVANIRRIAQTATADGIEVVLLTVPPNDAMRGWELTRLREINAELLALGRAQGIVVVDVYAALASAGGRLPTAYAAADRLHLNLRGEATLAATVYAALTAPPARGLAR
jgi:acyl-CoA thioesterase I